MPHAPIYAEKVDFWSPVGFAGVPKWTHARDRMTFEIVFEIVIKTSVNCNRIRNRKRILNQIQKPKRPRKRHPDLRYFRIHNRNEIASIEIENAFGRGTEHDNAIEIKNCYRIRTQKQN